MRTISKLAAIVLCGLVVAAYGGDIAANKATVDSAIASVMQGPSATHVRAVALPGPAKAVAATYAGFGVTAVIGGYPETGIPCFSCANGGGGFDVSLPIPQASADPASSFDFVVLMSSDTYTGACTTAYVVVSSTGTKVLGGKYTWPTGCLPGYTYMVSFPATLNLASGDYTVVGVGIGPVASKLINYLHIN